MIRNRSQKEKSLKKPSSFHSFFHPTERYPFSAEDKNDIEMRLLKKQSKAGFFISMLLFLLGAAYLVMYYGFHLQPDDHLYSVTAFYLLIVGPLYYFLFSLLSFFSPKRKALTYRLAFGLFFLFILVIIELFFYAACIGHTDWDFFSPVYLYLFIFAIMPSPFFLDGVFYLLSGELCFLITYGCFFSVQIPFLQYLFLFIIVSVVYVFFWEADYETVVKEKRLEFLSYHDALTELSNRAAFDQLIQKNWGSWTQGKKSFSALMFDIDSFKAYNDTFSHLGGDGCLRKIATCFLNSGLFDPSCFFRLGGDEFLLILPETDAGKAKEIGEKMVEAVHALALTAPKQAKNPCVTVSGGGVFAVLQEGAVIDELLAKADQELYRSKSLGGNRFSFSGGKVSDDAVSV
jgi:diguanylate cyclase (GGDEF)-like protein